MSTATFFSLSRGLAVRHWLLTTAVGCVLTGLFLALRLPQAPPPGYPTPPLWKMTLGWTVVSSGIAFLGGLLGLPVTAALFRLVMDGYPRSPLKAKVLLVVGFALAYAGLVLLFREELLSNGLYAALVPFALASCAVAWWTWPEAAVRAVASGQG